MLKVRVGPYLKVGKNVQKFDAGTGKNDPKVIVKLKKVLQEVRHKRIPAFDYKFCLNSF